MSSGIKTTINVTATGPFPRLTPSSDIDPIGAESFSNLYYRNLDTQRQVLSSIYRPTSTILWNGNAFLGGDAYVEFIARFPTTTHEVHSFDCHPIHSGMLSGVSVPGEPPIMILVVSGSVLFAGEREKRGFSESFLLKSDGDVFYVANQVGRFIYKP
jgi:Nuclear transport factor 2 (NTF2) domain